MSREEIGFEVRVLCQRGDITLEEFRSHPRNATERTAMVHALTDAALFSLIEHEPATIFRPKDQPPYNHQELVCRLYAPELVRRLKRATVTIERLLHQIVD
jgi:hypothetical protein